MNKVFYKPFKNFCRIQCQGNTVYPNVEYLESSESETKTYEQNFA